MDCLCLLTLAYTQHYYYYYLKHTPEKGAEMKGKNNINYTMNTDITTGASICTEHSITLHLLESIFRITALRKQKILNAAVYNIYTHSPTTFEFYLALSLEHKVPTIYLKRPSALCLYHSLNHNVLTMYTEKHCNWLSQLLLVICSSRITVICAANSPVDLPFV